MPTVTISGAANIEDALIVSGIPDSNWGGSAVLNLDNGSTGSTWRSLVRLHTDQIPGGTITGFRFKVWNGYEAAPGVSSEFFRLTDRSVWVAGVSDNAAETGACSWNAARAGSLNWLSAGCSDAGGDRDVAAGASHTWTVSAWNTIALPTDWATEWRNGTRINNGFMIQNTVNIFNQLLSSQWGASEKPQFEIDYTPTLTPAIAQAIRNRMRG